MGSNNCPDWDKAKSVAIVNLELPWLAYLGFAFTLLGFTLQFLAFPGARSIAEMRSELRVAKLGERIRKNRA